MIRSKDLTLFVVIMFFLGTGVLSTFGYGLLFSPNEHVELVSSDSSTPQMSAAVAPDEQIDRQGNIERLREKIAGETILTLNDAPLQETVQTSQTEMQPEILEQTLMTCDGPDDAIGMSETWPLEGVTMVVSEGARAFVHEVIVRKAVTEQAHTATGTVLQEEVIRTPLLQLPVLPHLLPEPTCLPSEVVGVTVDGSLLFNSDARLYQSYAPDTLIGYARDGFPIYASGPVGSDMCGGFAHPTGYRYVIEPDSVATLYCFVSQPQAFST